MSDPIKAGDIMSASWGYDQTNVDYYYVEKVSGSMATLAKIAGKTTETGFMCGDSVPLLPIKKTGEVIRRKLKPGYDGAPRAKIYSFGGYAKKLEPGADGQYPKTYVSWYA